MNKLLEVIYYDYSEKTIAENQLTTTEIKNATLSFLDTYFSHMPENEYDKAYNKLVDLCSAIEQNAFEVGFYASVQLLTNRKDF
ncbi:MAG: hypothetical protein K2G25_05505 [Oscillospiraceae bacterium]|nr:hypothetical protein [Oscillospiraceae bacterium]